MFIINTRQCSFLLIVHKYISKLYRKQIEHYLIEQLFTIKHYI